MDAVGTPGVPATQPVHTRLVVHPDVGIEDGENVVWCATMQVAWDRLTEWSGGQIELEGHPQEAVNLAMGRFPVEWIGEENLVAVAGRVDGELIDGIEEQLAERHGNRPDARLVDYLRSLPPGSVGAYAHLLKEMPFEWPFSKTDLMLFSPTDLDEELFRAEEMDETRAAAVRTFGLMSDWEDDPERAAIARQVRILRYDESMEDADLFVVELKTTNQSDRLILAKIEPAETLRATIAHAMESVTHPNTFDIDPKRAWAALAQMESQSGNDPREALELFTKLRQSSHLATDEDLMIPVLRIDLADDPAGLNRRMIHSSNPNLDGRPSFARHRVRFHLDESGASLESEAAAVGIFGAMPREFIFDRPFLVMLIREGAPWPYFAAWIGNAELMETVELEADPPSDGGRGAGLDMP